MRRGDGLSARFMMLAVLVSLIIGGVRSLEAQSPLLPTGARVRVVLGDSLRLAPLTSGRVLLVGTLTSLTADSRALRIADDTLRLARTSVRGLAVSRGASRARSAVEQAIIGGLVLATTSYATATRDGDSPRQRAFAGGIAGVSVGTLLGAIWPYEHWRRVRQ